MSSNNGATYLSNQRVVPNVALRLLQRELGYHHSGAGVHTSRSFSECIVPTHKVLHTEAPSYHIGKFTADGSWLVCFSLQLESVVLLEYLGPAPQPTAAAAAAANGPLNQQQSIAFHSFFKERWRLPLCSDTEQLCRDFCVTLQHGRFLLLASCTPQQALPGTTAAAGGAAAAGGTTQQAGRQQQQLAPEPGAAGDAGGILAQGQRAPSNDCCAVTTFHVVDLRRCVKVDQRQFLNDHFDLSGNACVSLYDNILALTSIRQQTVHLLQVNRDGTLADVQQIGRQCQADDSVPIELAAAAEHQWQLQKQHDRQQQQYWMHQQARALLPPKHCPPSAACQCSSRRSAHQQQQQQQMRPPVAPAQQQQQQARDREVTPAAAVAAAPAGDAARTTRHVRRRDADHDSSSNSSVDEGASEAADDTDSDDSMDEDRRRRVRRRLSPTAAGAGAGAAAAGVGPGAADAGQQARPQQQQQQHRVGMLAGLPAIAPRQQHQQQQQGRALTGRELAAATGDGGAAAATAATAAALLDPGGQLITGLRQRLLAFLYKTAGSQRRCDVAPSKRDFHHNFGVLSDLVIWRARLLGQDQLLLKLGAPTSGAATVADANPNGRHFFGVYDLRMTRFTGFYEGGSPQLLTEVLEHPCRLLVASGNLSPVERCCAAALYPAGFPVGLDHQQQQPAAAAAGSSGIVRQGPPASAAAGLSSSRMLGPPLPSAAAAAAAAVAAVGIAARGAGPPLQRAPAAASAGAGPSLQRASAAASAGAGSSLQRGPAAAAATAALLSGPVHIPSSDGSRQQRTSGATASGRVSDSSGSSSNKAARERLKFLRRVVLMVLPGLQNLSPSPYLDPHLFRYSKHLSPIIGLRNSPAHPVRFQLARQYPGFSPTVHQQVVGADGSGAQNLTPTVAPAGAAAGTQASQAGLQQQQQQEQQQEQHQGDMLQLDVLLPPTVVHGGEEVARRQLHLLHPSDPFVLVVVQTPGQPAQLDIYFRM